MLVRITARKKPNQLAEAVLINPDYISDVSVADGCTTIKMASGTEYAIEASGWLVPASEESPVIRQIFESMKDFEDTQSIDEWADEMYKKHGRPFYDYPDL